MWTTSLSADSNGVPRGGFAPGSTAQFYVWRVSTFPVTVPATVRYTLTGPNAVIDPRSTAEHWRADGRHIEDDSIRFEFRRSDWRL